VGVAACGAEVPAHGEDVVLRTVLTYGTYDLLHRGHVLLLQRAKQLGDYLIVGLSTDAFNEVKGKKCYYSYDERLLILSAIRFVDRVIPEDTWDQKRRDIVEFGVTTFVMGDDWAGKFDDLKDLCEVVYLPRTPGISTNEVKDYLSTLDVDADFYHVT
jgi:glycerol-3-phosphate cytidylyltransferase